MSKTTLFTALVLGLAAICAQPQSLFAAGPNVAGTWHLVFMPTNPQAAANIPGLATFTSDGMVVETDGAEAAPGSVTSGVITSYGTPGHGYWAFFTSSTGFTIAFDSLNINPDGSLQSRRSTVANVTLSTDSSGAPSFTGNYTTTVTSPDGGGMMTQTGTVKGNYMPMPTH